MLNTAIVACQSFSACCSVGFCHFALAASSVVGSLDQP